MVSIMRRLGIALLLLSLGALAQADALNVVVASTMIEDSDNDGLFEFWVEVEHPDGTLEHLQCNTVWHGIFGQLLGCTIDVIDNGNGRMGDDTGAGGDQVRLIQAPPAGQYVPGGWVQGPS